MNVLLIADTHLGAGRAPVLLDTLGDLLADADAIIHAGDITDPSILGALAEHAPVHAVLGNNDHGFALPERIVVELGGARFAAVHETGTAGGRTARLRQWFPSADVVVFGHSHLPWHEIDIDAGGHRQHQINPGSAIQRRRAPRRTAAVVEIVDGGVHSVRHVPLS